jgi:hypothetical protein
MDNDCLDVRCGPIAAVQAMSAFLPIATELRTSLEVRFVPKSEVGIIRPVPVCSHFPRVVSGPRQLEARSLPSGRGPPRSI